MNYKQLIKETNASIIAALEKGELPWVKQWDDMGADFSTFDNINGKTKTGYAGFNILRLACSREQNNFQSKEWLTFKQAKEMGLSVKKGSKATQIVRWIEPKKKTEEDEDAQNNRLFPVVFHLFNVDQLEGENKDDLFPRMITIVPDGTERDARVEEIIKNSGAKFSECKQGRAYYDVSADEIKIPTVEQFINTGAWADTALHELAHWTGNKKRLNRFEDAAKFADIEARAFEELVAEIASMMMCACLGIKHNVENQYGYIQGWLKAIKSDEMAVYKACTQAAKVVKYLKVA